MTQLTNTKQDRKIIGEKIDIRLTHNRDFPDQVTFKDIRNAVGVEDHDKVIGLAVRTEEVQRWSEDDETYVKYPVLVLYRERPETDDKFFTRVKKEADVEKERVEKEKLLYLSLKAKYENTGAT